MSHQTNQLIDQLIRAHYPVIYVVSHEERRVTEAVAVIAESQGKPVFTWTISRGIRAIEEPDVELDGSTRDPIAALEFIAAYGRTDDNPAGDAGIFIMKDLPPFFQDPVVVRTLRDCINDLATTLRTIVLLAPALNVPADCEKEIAVVNYPLPDASELAGLLDDFANALPAHVPVDLNGDGSREQVAHALQSQTPSQRGHLSEV